MLPGCRLRPWLIPIASGFHPQTQPDRGGSEVRNLLASGHKPANFASMSFKFCPECGGALQQGDRFCSGCGKAIVATTAARSGLPLSGVLALMTLLVIGGGFWLYDRLVPEPPRPLKPGERPAGAVAAGQGAPGSAQPMVELPDEVRNYIANLRKEADAAPDDREKWVSLALSLIHI